VAVQDFIINPADIDFGNIVAGVDDLRQWLPQRGVMAQLTAIVYDDVEQHVCVGYRDLAEDEFWASGHMPGMPLMPGVIMCEAAAQVLTYHVQRHDLSGVEMVGFGGLDNVRFRGVVRPGERLAIACQVLKFRRGRMVVCRFQEFVGTTLVCEGEMTGIPLPLELLQQSAAKG
jgi:3-hydroxyacyl-[acyl-carrier-protein] dehydratase